MDSTGRSFEAGTPVFDHLDIDLVIKVLANTIFSPFFSFFIPIFYIFQGLSRTHPVVLGSAAFFVFNCSFWAFLWISKLYRNQGNLLWAPKRIDWSDQIVVITGGSSGVGELLATTLAVKNVTVVVLDINPIETDNYNITYYKCDVSKWAEVEAVSKKVIEEIGHPTMIINNAGVVQAKLITELTEADISKTFGVNIFAHFFILKAFLPSLLQAKKGHVVSVSSILAHSGVCRMSDYCASKAAVLRLHESLRYELDKKYNCPSIRTTLIMPGHILTPMFRHMHLPNRAWRKFAMPAVAPIDVVKRIIQSLDSQFSEEITLPFYGHTMPFLYHLPSFLRDFAQWITGADESMDHYAQRPEGAQESPKEK